MTVASPHDGSATPFRRVLNLICEEDASPERLRGPLEADFVIEHFSPRAVLQRTASERAEMMKGVVATLIDWDVQSPMLLAVLRDAARRNTVPLVVLCGSNPAEHVAALMVGGDVCLTYPLNPTLLQARLLAYQRLVVPGCELPAETGDGMPQAAVLDIGPPRYEAHDTYTVGALRLDGTARHFFVSGCLVALTPKEFDLMAFLMRRVGACQTHDAILDRVWGIDYEAGTNVLCVMMHGLRRKLAACGLGEIIQTVRGVGYRLADPEIVRTPTPSPHVKTDLMGDG